MTPDEVAKLEQAVTQASREIRRLEKLIAERDAALTAAQQENARLLERWDDASEFVRDIVAAVGRPQPEPCGDVFLGELALQVVGQIEEYKHRAERAEADTARLREALEEMTAWYAAHENMGIYPAAVVRDSVEVPRTERQDGWNEGIIGATDKAIAISAWLETLDPAVRHKLVMLIVDDHVWLDERDKQVTIYTHGGDDSCELPVSGVLGFAPAEPIKETP